MKDNGPLPEATFEQSELKRAIQRISEGLTINQRKVFVLRELQGFSTDEVAQILKCKVATVRVHLSKAREHIKNALKRHGLGRVLELSSQEGKKDEVPKS